MVAIVPDEFEYRKDFQAPTTLEEQFRRLASEWREGTKGLSNFNKIWSHPAYVAIGDMGQAVLPILIRELKSRPDWWFAALHRIVGHNPVPRESRGILSEMTRHWLEYAKQNGLETE